jgi:DNA-binding response OmpR family regulator
MQTITILLVDDQKFVGLALGRLLSAEPDLVLHCCTEATAAVAEANRIAPSLILQDLILPAIDGLTLVSMYRANPATRATPIVVLSGNDDAATRARAIEAGANDYLVKLPAKDELVACIRKYGSGHPAPGDTLDQAVMATFRDGPPGMASFTIGLIDQFILEAGSQVQMLRDAAQRQDTGAITMAAHSLRGSSQIMGASRLGALCAQLEHDAAAPGSTAAALVTAIDQELVQVRIAFAAERRHIHSQETTKS